MKKLIIFTSLAIIFITAGVLSYLYFASLQKVSIVLHDGVTSATVYKSSSEGDSDTGGQTKGDQVEKVTANKEVTLTKGSYYIVPEGDRISHDQIPFTVENKPITVDVNPDFTSDFLAKQLEGEAVSITRAMFAQFPLIESSYDIGQAKLYKKGEWYGALLTGKNDDPSAPGDYYRVVLHKENDTWKVIGTPEIVLTTAKFSTIPKDVLTAINQLNV